MVQALRTSIPLVVLAAKCQVGPSLGETVPFFFQPVNKRLE
jgi:hypothetical protein